MGKITWRRYTDSQRDAVTHTMSVYAGLALSGTDDVLSSIRGVRPVRSGMDGSRTGTKGRPGAP